jgi:hypothetical protein
MRTENPFALVTLQACDMNRLTIISLLAVIFLSTCLDAPRDNIYDPKNPDRAYMLATVYEFGLYPLESALVYLSHDGEIVRTDTSNDLGEVEFEEIVPGVYGLTGEVQHYSSVSYLPDSIWAGEYITNRRIEFLTLAFEDDILNTSSPHRFEPIYGAWAITEDTQHPEAHSTPQVYTCVDSISNESAFALCEPETYKFFFEAKLQVKESSAPTWQAGVIFRYQDENNYLSFTITPETTFCSQVINGQHAYTRVKAHESTVGTWRSLQVECHEVYSMMKMYIDDVVIFSLTDDIFVGGRVGLIVSDNNQPSPVFVNFDDVTLDLTQPFMQ